MWNYSIEVTSDQANDFYLIVSLNVQDEPFATSFIERNLQTNSLNATDLLATSVFALVKNSHETINASVAVEVKASVYQPVSRNCTEIDLKSYMTVII